MYRSTIVVVFVLVCFEQGNTQNISNEDVAMVLEHLSPIVKNLNISKIPIGEADFMMTMKEKCDKNNANPAIMEGLQERQEFIKGCLLGVMEIGALQTSLQKARENGTQEVERELGKYCGKVETTSFCFPTVIEDLKKCLNFREVRVFETSLNVIRALKNNLCYRNGPLVAEFVQQGGIDCTKQREEQIKTCFNETLTDFKHNHPTNVSLIQFATTILEKYDCSEVENLKECIKNELEQCESSSPAGILEKIVDDIFGEIPCTLKNFTQACLDSFINTTKLELELNEAKKTGSMDEVFGRYCNKYENISLCYISPLEKSRKWISEQESKNLNESLKTIEKLKDFLCYRDGDRMAMFVAEKGVECMKEQKEMLQQCVNTTFGSRVPTELNALTFLEIPTFLITEKDCDDFDEVRVCVNTELEKCDTPTPANLVNAFFKYLKSHTPCRQQPKNSAHTYVASLLIVIGTLFTHMFYV